MVPATNEILAVVPIHDLYTQAREADRHNDFNAARGLYDAALDQLKQAPYEISTAFALAELRIAYASMNTRWSLQPDNASFQRARFLAAERQLAQAEASMSDLLTYGNLADDNEQTAHIWAGIAQNLLGRLYTAHEAQRTKGTGSAPSKRRYSDAMARYSAANRHFLAANDAQALLLNEYYIGRHSQMHETPYIQRAVGNLALSLRFSRLPDPASTSLAITIPQPLTLAGKDNEQALESILQNP